MSMHAKEVEWTAVDLLGATDSRGLKIMFPRYDRALIADCVADLADHLADPNVQWLDEQGRENACINLILLTRHLRALLKYERITGRPFSYFELTE